MAAFVFPLKDGSELIMIIATHVAWRKTALKREVELQLTIRDECNILQEDISK